jgi:hypothetical protein
MWKAHLNAYLLEHPRVDYKTAQKRASKTFQKMKKESMVKSRRKSILDDVFLMQNKVVELNRTAEEIRETIPWSRQKMQKAKWDPQLIQILMQEREMRATRYSTLAQELQRKYKLAPPAF